MIIIKKFDFKLSYTKTQQELNSLFTWWGVKDRSFGDYN